MIDHTGIAVSDFGKSKAFYAHALAPIGYKLLMELPAASTGHSDVAGFGAPPKPDFWIAGGKANVPPIHVAFRVATRTLVDAFYKRPLLPVAATMALQVSVPTTTPPITERSF